MAGFMKKLQGHVYDGSHVAATKLANGVFVEITSTGVKALAAAGDMVLRIAEKTTLWQMPALVQDVVVPGDKEIFLTENEWDVWDNKDYNTAEYEIEAGAFVKMHRPLAGEQMIVTVADALYKTLNEGDLVTPAANGTVAKKSA